MPGFKNLFQVFVCWLLLAAPLYAQTKKKMLPEQLFMRQVTAAFQSQQVRDYLPLVPAREALDSLKPVLETVFRYSGMDAGEVAQDGFQMSLERATVRRFQQLSASGTEMGMHWAHLRLARYQLVRQVKTRDSLLEALVPERYQGYVFLFDPMLQKTFCMRIPDLFVFGSRVYGGAPIRVFPAETIPAYERHAEAAARAEAKGQKYIAFTPPELPDEEVADSTEEEAVPGLPAPKGIVAERRYFTGYFDKEKPVELFIRGYRGDCADGICRWNAVMRVGNEADWVPMTLVKKNGSWILTELLDIATMELKADGSDLTGTWTAADDETGYEVKLTEERPSNRMLSILEEVLDDFRL
ncbi:MAG: hypothetical protein EOP52_03345 [Sphingobacteriales bacterium]|nr:MAG: hypothetical protein EOP52_03345 [Sphingobacteriales bacterium]